MAVNMVLANRLGISQENIEKINAIHEDITALVDSYEIESQEIYTSTRQQITRFEFMLQELWGFSQDSRYHTHVQRLADKHLQLEWVGRAFQCVKTRKVKTIEKEDVSERGTWGVGECFIDFGRANGYSRIVGELEEIK